MLYFLKIIQFQMKVVNVLKIVQVIIVDVENYHLYVLHYVDVNHVQMIKYKYLMI